jgi:hypothetical protein
MESMQATQEDNGIRMMVEIYMFIYAHKVREAVEDLTADASCATHCLVAISRTCLSVFVICQSTWFHFSTNLILSDSQSLPWHHQNKSLIAHFLTT